ncbi:winged helix-turn-helix domain-containing protein [Aliikangiella sp. IMCC44653]
MHNKENFRVGPYLVIPSHDKLAVDDQEFKLEPKIMQVLCCLIEHHGEVLSRQQIAELLWPGKVAGLEVVTRAIFELRKVFNDDSKAPQYIKTVPRKGYVFIYPVENIAADNASPLGDGLGHGSGQKSRHFSASTKLVSALIALGLILLIAVYFNQPQTPAPHYSTRFLTDFSQDTVMHSVSPDWQKAIFVQMKALPQDEASVQTQTHTQSLALNQNALSGQLAILDLKSQAIHTLTEDNFLYRSPVWGQTNKYWYFVKCSTNECQVVRQHISTGELVTLYQSSHRIKYLAVSADETKLALSVFKDNKIDIVAFTLDNSASLPLNHASGAINIKTPSEIFNEFPQFSKDSQKLYFISRTSRGINQLSQFDLDTQKLTATNLALDTVWGLAVQSNHEIWLSGRASGVHALWKYNMNDQKLARKTDFSAQEIPASLAVSSAGDRIIYASRNRDINIASLRQSLGFVWSDLNSDYIDFKAIYDHQIKTTFFVSNRSGAFELWQTNSKSTKKITDIKADMIERPVVSSNGKHMAFIARKNNRNSVIIFSLPQGKVISRHQLAGLNTLLNWSIDGDNLYYSANENNQFNVYRLNIRDQKKSLVLINSSKLAQESADKNLLYYIDDKSFQLMVKSNNGEVKSLFKFNSYANLPSAYQSKIIGDVYYYIATSNGLRKLKSVNLKTNEQLEHFTIPSNLFITDISFDNEPFIIVDSLAQESSRFVQLNAL